MADQPKGSKWRAMAERAKAQIAHIRETQAETLAVAIDSVAIYGVPGILAYMHGLRGGVPMTAGVPWDVGFAGLGSLVGFWALSNGKSWGRHVAVAGAASGSYWFASFMAKKGMEKRQAEKKYLGRQLTTEEAQAANVQPRPPVLAGPGVPRAHAPRAHAHAGIY